MSRCGLHLHTSVEGLVYGLAGDNILELGADECWALTWLHMLELDDLLELAINFEDQAVLEIRGICHGSFSF